MRRTIAGLGRTLVTLGLLILLFVAYQLWGTGILTARAQSDLRDEFEALQQQVAVPTVVTTVPDEPGVPAPTTTAPPVELPVFELGDPVGIIEMPRIGASHAFVEGTGRDELKKGPGRYPASPMPGQRGNAAIAGHRTTYGAPFNRIDELSPGDEIVVTTLQGRFVYRVRPAPDDPTKGHIIVSPSDVWVVGASEEPELTLTSCHPKYSARQRIVVKADLVVEQSAAVVEPAPAPEPEPDEGGLPGDEELAQAEEISIADTFAGDDEALGPTYGWGAVLAVVGLAWWWAFRRWRHPFTFLAGVAPFLPLLFVFYMYLEQAIPSGY